jgi:2-phosphoglycerate kinase
MRILIYGTPGAGKTTSARLLHDKTGLELYEGDYLREVKLPSEVGESEDTFLYIGTKQAWRHFGKLNNKNAIKGLLAVRSSMLPYIEKELTERKSIIFEAAFLDPSKTKGDELYLVVTSNENKHRKQFFKERKYFHPEYGTKELEEGFEASRLIQSYLIEEASKLRVNIIENDSNEQVLLSQFNTIV